MDILFKNDDFVFSYRVGGILMCNGLNKCKGVISRQGLIYIPSMFILGAIFHETGLIWAQPVADVLSLLLAIGLYFRMSGKGND